MPVRQDNQWAHVSAPSSAGPLVHRSVGLPFKEAPMMLSLFTIKLPDASKQLMCLHGNVRGKRTDFLVKRIDF